MIVSVAAFLYSLRQHRLLDEADLDRTELEFSGRTADVRELAATLLDRELLTPYQADLLLRGEAAELRFGEHVGLDLLGEGGMGRVYKAVHRNLDRIDAIKVIRPDRVVSTVSLKRFFLEARAIARLNHPNIVKVYDAREENDRHYFVMEFVEGVDLGKVVQQQGPMTVGQACACIRQAALGLQHAHEKGLIHRDIKPSNLLLSVEENVVKMLDLGLARLREQQPTAAGLTREGQLMGTPDYMAPEQAEDSTSVDIRADIYSLGCSLYQLLTSQPPFPGGTLVEKLSRHSHSMPMPLMTRRTDTPPALWSVMEKMLAKAREGRFNEPGEVADALAPFGDTAQLADLTNLLRSRADQPPAMIPQTLDEPAGGQRSNSPSSHTNVLSNTPPPPSSQTAPLILSRVAPHAAPTSDGVLTRESGPATVVPTSAPFREKKKSSPALLIALVALVLVGAGVAVAVSLLNKEKEPDPVVQDDPTKDRKKHDEKPPPRDKDDKKTSNEGKPDLPADKGPGRGKCLAASMEQPLGGGKAAAGAGQPGQVKGRADRERLDLWADLPPRTQQVVFSLDSTRAIARSGTAVFPFDLVARKLLEKQFPLTLVRDDRLNSPQALGPIALTPSDRQLVFVTLNTTEREVRGKRNLLTEFEAVVRVRGEEVTHFYGDVAAVASGKSQMMTRSLAFSPDGSTLITGSGKKINRWDTSARDEYHHQFRELRLGTETECFAFQPDGKAFAAGCADGKVYLLPESLNREGALAVFKGPTRSVRSVAFLGADHLLAGDIDGMLYLWKVPVGATGEPVEPLERFEGSHAKDITCITTSPAGDLIATGGVDGKVRLAKRDAKESLWTMDLGDPVTALQFQADGSLLAATTKKLGGIRATLPEAAVVKQ